MPEIKRSMTPTIPLVVAPRFVPGPITWTDYPDIVRAEEILAGF
jgi:hypothetical protein